MRNGPPAGVRWRGHLLGVAAPLGALVVAALLLLGPEPAVAADDPVTVQLDAGYGGSVPLGGWVPVQVDVTNKGPDVRASLTISVDGQGGYGGKPFAVPFVNGSPGPVPPFIGGFGGGGSPVSRRLSVALPTGTPKHFTVYLPSAPGTVKAQVTAVSGKSLATAQGQLSFPGTNVSIAIVSDNRSALNQIGAVQSLAAAFGGPPQLIHLAAARLPDAASALHAFRMIAIDDASTESFTAAQRQALEDYVGRGGSLLVTGGGAWHKTLAGLPASLVPLSPTGTQTLPGLPKLSAQLQNAPMAGNIEVAVGPRTSGVTALGEGSLPILVEVDHGLGRVLYLAIDPAAEPPASWSGTLPLLRQVLVRASAPGLSPGPAYGSYPGGPGGLQAQGGSIFQALANIPSLDLPSPALIAVVLAVFILLVGPVNHFVLRRIRRPDLAWGTIPALVAVSAGSIYGIGLTVRGTDVLADRVRLVYLQNGESRGFVTSGTGVFAPHSGSHAVSTTSGSQVGPLSGSGPFIFGTSPVIFGNGFSGGRNFVSGPASNSLIVEEGNPDTVRLNWSNPDSIQAFGEEYAETHTGGIDQHLTVANGRITGTIVNHLPVALTDAVVLSGTAYKTLGAIPPGGSVQVDIPIPGASPALGGNATPLPNQIYLHAPAVCLPAPNCGAPSGSIQGASRPDARQREATRRSDILSGILGSNQSDVPNPLLVAWSSSTAPASPVRVDGRRTQLKELDAFILPLTAEVSGSSLPVGLVRGRQIDTTGGSLSAGASNPTYLTPGAQTVFEFNLPPGGGDTVPAWTRLSVSTTKTLPLGAPGNISPTPSAAVYNFRTSVWDPLTLNLGSPVDIASPADHVSPDGQARVRLQAGNAAIQFLPALELSGERAGSA